MTRVSSQELLLPDFRRLVVAAIDGFNARFCNRGVQVVLFETLRTAENQKAGFDKGRSKIDGVSRFSRHQFGAFGLAATVAADLVVSVEGVGLTWDSKYIPYYNALGRIVNSLGLQSGIDWNMNGVLVQDDPSESFYDGPHMQVPSNEFRKIAQRMLAYMDLYSSGIDGSIGPGTAAAMQAFRRDAGILVPDWRASKLDPDTWNALVRTTPESTRRMYP